MHPVNVLMTKLGIKSP